MWTQLDTSVCMSDGTSLAADVYLPNSPASVPVLVCRSPYDKQMQLYVEWAFRFVKAGFGVVIQDCRGRYASDGAWIPYEDEIRDGADTISWVASQPWCSGSIGMFGISYVGFTQLLAALGGNSHLKALVPIGCQEDNFGHLWLDGVMQLQNLINFFQIGRRTMNTQAADRLDLERAYRVLPVCDALDRIAVCEPFQEFLSHPTFDDYWSRHSLKGRYSSLEPAVMLVTGWYDNLLHEQFKIFAGLNSSRPNDGAGRPVKLVVGPWTHFDIGAQTVAGVDFGPDAAVDIPKLQLDWFRQHLNDNSPSSADPVIEPPIHLFAMGENKWRSEWEWPLARTTWVPMYLGSEPRVDSGSVSKLVWSPIEGSIDSSTFVYDPADPVPTCGGQSMFLANTGPRRRDTIQQRADVLTFISDALSTSLEVTGPISLILFAASDATDTDFTATLVDIDLSGHSVHVTEGITRARYRSSVTTPSLLAPGEIVTYHISLWETSIVFAKGHRIGIEISSSNFPRFDRNLNTGGSIGFGSESQTANQTIFHSVAYPSRLVLPVIPRS